MPKAKRILFTGILLLALPLMAGAWGSDLSLPPPAPVVDEFGLLQNGEVAQLEDILRLIKRNSGVEISVYIPSTLRGREIEDFGIAVTDQWKLGRKKEDKGLLLVIAPKERKMRFEVGYGLEGDLTDVFTRRVLDDVMRPYFKAGRYYEGIVGSLAAINQKVPLGLSAEQLPESRRRSGGLPPIAFFAFLIIFVIFAIMSRLAGFSSGRYGGGGWTSGGGSSWGGGGSSGGSSWGGGGGGFGGGGSSSSW